MQSSLAPVVALAVAFLGSAPAAVGADGGWPRTKSVGGFDVTIFQPQIEEWPDHRALDFRAAIAIAPAGSKEPDYGVIEVHAETLVDWQNRSVLFSNAKYGKIGFPGAAAAKAANYTALVKQAFPEGTSCELALDRVLADLQQSKESQRQVQVNLDPPPIFYSAAPAILVVFTGNPVWQPVTGTQLLFATNTNWPLFMQAGSSNCFLLDQGGWLTANDPIHGSWTPTTSLPPDFGNLPVNGNWGEVSGNVPGVLVDPVPNVFVSTRPAELIVTNGDAQLIAIPGTPLMYVVNTASDLFLDVPSSTYYHLAAGRWFSAKDLAGPWASASANLPPSFAKIPIDSPKADVLASVAGTPQAQEAVLQASIPHTAKVNVDTTTIAVQYDGAPLFAPIPGSESVLAAQNTTFAVFQVGSQYYCCHAGIWFQSNDRDGPWSVCTTVAPAIYTIPISSPYHYVTYVYVYDSSEGSVVAGYTAGYTGEYVSNGVLVFGAGWWLGADATWGRYDAWRCSPAWYSYGCAAHYSYYDGGYVRGAAWYGPYGGAGWGARYDPATGAYARGAAAYGPAGAAGVASAWNPWTGRGGATAQATTPYGSWGRSVAYGNQGWAETGHKSNAWGTTAGVRTSTGAAGAIHAGPMGTTAVAQSASGNVYAGHDGNVYRHSDDGGWDKHTDAGWQNTGWKGATSEQQAQHPSAWSGGGAAARESPSTPAVAPREAAAGGDGDVSRQLNSDSWGRQWGSYRSGGGGFGGGRGRR